MKKLFLTFILGTLIGSLIACSVTTDPAEAYRGESPSKIYTDGKTSLVDRNYGDAIKHFEALDVQYPFNAEAEKAQLYLIYAYYMKEDYALAVAAADRYIRLHPASEHVDYAYYMRGISDYYQNLGLIERIFSINLATRDLTQMQKSYQDFSEVVSRFPTSRYAPPSHQYMIYLRNVMADHEFQIAKFYYEKRAYVAAINRSSALIAHYQGAPSVIPALELLAQSYHQLGMKKLEEDTLNVLHYNV